jgi:hypothetical protein
MHFPSVVPKAVKVNLVPVQAWKPPLVDTARHKRRRRRRVKPSILDKQQIFIGIAMFLMALLLLLDALRPQTSRTIVVHDSDGTPHFITVRR